MEWRAECLEACDPDCEVGPLHCANIHLPRHKRTHETGDCPAVERPPMTEGGVEYDRDTLVDVILHHGRTSIKGCHCGWAELGRCHAEHVADVYEAAMADRP